MRKYLNVLTIGLAIFLFSGCKSSSPKPKDSIKKEVSKETKKRVEEGLSSKIKMPPESNLIDKLEEEVIIDDTPEEVSEEVKEEILEEAPKEVDVIETPSISIAPSEPKRQLIESVD